MDYKIISFIISFVFIHNVPNSVKIIIVTVSEPNHSKSYAPKILVLPR